MTKMLAEHSDHFEMTDGKSPFKVPKAGLSEKLQDKIRGMCEPEKMAGGGPVARPAPMLLDEHYGQVHPTMVKASPYTFTEALPQEMTVLPDNGPPRDAMGNVKPEWIAAGYGDAPAYEGSQDVFAEKRPPVNIDTATPSEAAARPSTSKYDPSVRVADMGIKGLRERGAGPAPVSDEPITAPPTAAKPKMLGSGNLNPGKSDIEAGYKMGVRGAEDEADAGIKLAEAEANKVAAYGRQLEINQIEQQEWAAKAAAKSQEDLGKLAASEEEMKQINTTVDPGRFWASKSTGDKIAGIIGLALGAFGAGPDGINRASVMMNQAIDRDIEAQKAEFQQRLARGKANVEGAGKMYERNRQILGDTAAANSADKSAALALSINKAEQMIAGAKTEQARAQGQALLAALQTQKGQFDNKTAQENSKIRMGWAATNAQLAAAGGPGKETAAGKDSREAGAAYATLKSNLDDLEGLVKGTNAVTEKFGDKAAQLRTKQALLVGQIKAMDKLGTLDAGVRDHMMSLVGDLTGTFTLDSTKIAQLRALAEGKRTQAINEGAKLPPEAKPAAGSIKGKQ